MLAFASPRGCPYEPLGSISITVPGEYFRTQFSEKNLDGCNFNKFSDQNNFKNKYIARPRFFKFKNAYQKHQFAI
jgi:hypothetical protein